MSREIFIHAGAHRTGSSSFQMFLSVNAERIRSAGYDLAYPARDGIPGGRLRLRLPGPGTGPRRWNELQEFLNEEMQVYSTAVDRPLILSEENIPGRMIHFYGGKFFPKIRRRLKFLKAALPGPVGRLVYVVRPYDQLYVSAYRKRAEDNAVDPFSTIRPVFLKMDAGWPHVISALRDVLQPKHFTVLTYKSRGSDFELFQQLVPGLAAVGSFWKEPGQKLNLSASDTALVELQRHYAQGRELQRTEWQDIIARHSRDRTIQGFATFTPDEGKILRETYQRDLDQLREMAGITLIE